MAGKGGGAWKVAYADFVTAMMAFFLVMWICGQDQQVRRAVSYYFMDPFASSKTGSSKKPSKTGAVSEHPNTGGVPMADSVAMGRGRNPYVTPGESSVATKLVSDWLQADKEASKYWREQAQQQRESARRLKSAATATTFAARQLSKQLKDEITRGIPPQVNGVYEGLLFESISGVNWTEIAEDLLSR